SSETGKQEGKLAEELVDTADGDAAVLPAVALRVHQQVFLAIADGLQGARRNAELADQNLAQRSGAAFRKIEVRLPRSDRIGVALDEEAGTRVAINDAAERDANLLDLRILRGRNGRRAGREIDRLNVDRRGSAAQFRPALELVDGHAALRRHLHARLPLELAEDAICGRHFTRLCHGRGRSDQGSDKTGNDETTVHGCLLPKKLDCGETICGGD